MSKIITNQIQHTQNGAQVFTLPTSDGSTGQVMKTDGSGALSFATAVADGSITAAKLASGVGGKVLQVVGNSNGTAFTTTGVSFVDTGITQSITLSVANSKVLFIGNIGCDTARNNQLAAGRLRLHRSGATNDSDRTYGGNQKNVGGYVGGANTHNRFMAQFTMTGFDTELGNNAAGTTLTYKFQCRCDDSGNNTDFRINPNGEISFITLLEIAV